MVAAHGFLSLEPSTLQLQPPENFVSLLLQCSQDQDLGFAKQVHTHMCCHGMEAYTTVGNHLISCFVECGSIQDAQQVFSKSVSPNEYSWTSLLQGYVELGQFQQAFRHFEQMRDFFIDPSAHTFVAMLKACSGLGSVEEGLALHHGINLQGFEGNSFISNSLVDMYVKCGCLLEARDTFIELPERDVVTWTAMIAGYAEHMLCDDVLDCLEWMQLEGISPNTFTFVCSLKTCNDHRVIDKGHQIHLKITMHGYEGDYHVGNSLVDMYARCGSIVEAQRVFEELSNRDVVSWTSLIAGCAEHGLHEDVLDYFEMMQIQGVLPNPVTFVYSLKACGNLGAAEKGHQLHSEIVSHQYESDISIGNTLVDMYFKLGLAEEAQKSFDSMKVQDFVSWNMLMTGYIELGLHEEALRSMCEMQSLGLHPNGALYACCLKACGCIGAVDRGQEIHSELLLYGIEIDCVIGSTLVNMYIKSHFLQDAIHVFKAIPARDAVLWTTLSVGYVEDGLGDEALNMLMNMELDGISVDAPALVCSLAACGVIGDVNRVREMHDKIIKLGYESNLVICSTLIETYAECCSLYDGHGVFTKIKLRDASVWNALFAGYIKCGLGEEALHCLEEMKSEGVCTDSSTVVCSLNACGSIGALNKGRDIHTELAKQGLEGAAVVGNSLMDMYVKCGSLVEAREVFDTLFVHDIVSWTTLINGYSEHGLHKSALQAFSEMHFEGVSADAVAYICVLKACGSMGLVCKGQHMHNKIVCEGFDKDVAIHNTLADMYNKCGCAAEASNLASS